VTTPIKAGWFDNVLVFVDVEGCAKMGRVFDAGYTKEAKEDG
jgi:hypothetical protein